MKRSLIPSSQDLMLMLTISLSSLSRFYRRQVLFRNTSDSCPHGPVALGIDRYCSLTGSMLSIGSLTNPEIIHAFFNFVRFFTNLLRHNNPDYKISLWENPNYFFFILNYYNFIHFPFSKRFAFCV